MVLNKKSKTFMARCKSGCNTCKLRRIKCGEERPACARCVKSGWKCDGYADTKASALTAATAAKSLTGAVPNMFLSPAPRGNEKELAVGTAKEESDRTIKGATPVESKRRAKTYFSSISKNWQTDGHSTFTVNNPSLSSSSWTTSALAASPAAYEVPFKVPGTPNERQLFQYFCLRAAPDLSGYSSHTFWNNLVLKLCYYEPYSAVRHATLALSAFHRDYAVEGITRPDVDCINSNALQQYNKSLRQLQKYFSNKELLDERTVLICCKLFYCIEIARQDYTTAIRHAKSGLIILKDWKDRQEKQPTSNMNSGPDDDIKFLVEAWAAFDAQVGIFENGQPPYLVLTTPEERSGAIPCVPSTFYSLSDAWGVTNKLMNWGFHFLASRIEHEHGMPEDTEIGNLREWWVLEKEIDQWSVAFETFIHNPDSVISCLDKDSVTMCATIHRGTKVLVHLAAGKSSFEMNNDFNDILSMAESIIDNQDVDSETPHRGFAFETGLVAILWLLTMNCQDPAMRARAIWLMKMWPRREGLWDGARMSSVVERVQDCAQSNPVSTGSPKLKLGSSAERAGEVKGDLYMHGFSKILSLLDGKRRKESEIGTKSPEIILAGADYLV